jgi:peroxiredoxin Q/BCP
MIKIGQKAPAFSGKNQNGTVISLDDFKGKPVVLYFYPKDDTPGCTKEACSFRDAYQDILDLGAAIIGVSRDTVEKHKKFADKYDLPFNLLADEDGTATESYGVWVEKSMYGKKYMGIQRATYLIDQKGHIHQSWPKVSIANHCNEVIDGLKCLTGRE